MTSELQGARERVVAASRRLAALGLVVGTAGNVSERLADRIAITPTGAALDSVTAEEIAIVDLEGTQHGGDFRPTSELDLHLGAYVRHHANAVVHTHAPMATAVACVLDELPIVHYALMELGGPVRVAPYRTFGTPELAAVTLDALQGRSAALMSNHGAITIADTAHAAVERALLLEWGCTLYYRASTMGTPRTLNAQEQADFLEAIATRNYGTTQKI